jgi:hypothetical protein
VGKLAELPARTLAQAVLTARLRFGSVKTRGLNLASPFSTVLFHQSHFDWSQYQLPGGSHTKSTATMVWGVRVTHSAMPDAKSIASPMRCLTSLSHALGLVP